jgi:hypothetical protein
MWGAIVFPGVTTGKKPPDLRNERGRFWESNPARSLTLGALAR